MVVVLYLGFRKEKKRGRERERKEKKEENGVCEVCFRITE